MFKKFFGKTPTQPPAKAPEKEEKSSWLGKLKEGLTKSSSKITSGISELLTARKLDAAALEALEEVLISADLGVQTAAHITAALGKGRFDKEITEQELKEALASQVAEILAPVAKPLLITRKPHIILVCGVNGNGKTTTIGKLAAQFQQQGKKVLLVACDTFRAAAVEQLTIWAERVGCGIITGAHQADPASVAYAAVEQAEAEQVDVVLIDTAGRLQNKQNLMEELLKIVRVIQKREADAPHDTLLVLDATTGQNAFSQVEVFKEMVKVTGLVVTKLDGSAKGGVVVGLAQRFGLPIHAIGVGESIQDLHAFEAEDFARNLVGI